MNEGRSINSISRFLKMMKNNELIPAQFWNFDLIFYQDIKTIE